jgi:hypothetical protein
MIYRVAWHRRHAGFRHQRKTATGEVAKVPSNAVAAIDVLAKLQHVVGCGPAAIIEPASLQRKAPAPKPGLKFRQYDTRYNRYRIWSVQNRSSR